MDRVAQVAQYALWGLSAFWFQKSTRWLVNMFGMPYTKIGDKQNFSYVALFLLSYSESFSMIAAFLILYDNNTLSWSMAVILANLVNLVGYLKYVYQMWVNLEYITLSFHFYNTVWLIVSLSQMDPLYYVFFRYPFEGLMLVEQYINMKGRKILFDEFSIVIHCVDHILHGMISCRVLLYHYFGIETMLYDIITVPFILILSDKMVRMQDPANRKP